MIQGDYEDLDMVKAKKELLPMQPGDVPDTYADIDDLVKNFKSISFFDV